jgi:hypothetical protein
MFVQTQAYGEPEDLSLFRKEGGMTKRSWNNGLLWLAVVWGVILLCFCLMGCRTKMIAEYVAVHDTLRTVQTDTVRDVHVVVKTDTLRQMETHYFTVNEFGDTIREVHHYHEVEKTVVVDSTKRYQSKVDSLQSIVDKLATKEVVKEPSFWERWKRVIDVVVTVVVVGLFVWFLRWLDRKNR